MPVFESILKTISLESDVYKRALDTSSIVSVTDPSGTLVYVNENFCKISQYSKEELIGQTHRIISSDYHGKAFYKQLYDTITYGSVWKGELQNKAKDGTLYWLMITIVPFRDNEGKIEKYIEISSDITAQKQVQDIKYHLLFDHTQEGLLMVNADGSHAEVNDAFCKLLGYDRDEFLKMRKEDIILTDDPNLPELIKVRAQRGHFEGIMQLRHKDGSIILADVSTASYNDEKGESCAYVRVRDMTQKLKAEEALRSSEQRFRALIENSKDVVVVSASDGKMTYFSPSFKDVYGYEPDELLGRISFELMHPDELERNAGMLMELVENPGSSVSLTLRIKHKDGSWRWAEATSTSQLHNPVVNGIVSNFRDVTERFIAEQALRDSEQKFRTLIENNKDVIALTAPDGSISYMSPSIKDMLGYTPEELLGTPAINIMHPDEIQFNLGQLSSLLENPGSSVFKIMRLLHKNGEWRWIEATTTNHLDSPTINGLVSNFRDVTERKKAEEALEQLNISLEQKIHERTIELQESNKALKSFSSIAAHDLQSPLRIMSGYASIIMDEYKDKLGPDGYELFRVIVKESRHMSQLINDLLNFSSMSYKVLSKELVDFDTMVAEVVKEVRLSEKDTKAKVHIGSLGTCMSDKMLIRQVWINLISNAFKYSSKKENPLIEIGCLDQNGEKIYFVKDNGTGFNMAYVSKLFNLFKRLHTSNEFKGTGIGLAIVSNIIQRHDGRIWTEAEEGNGATFYFTLPE